MTPNDSDAGKDQKAGESTPTDSSPATRDGTNDSDAGKDQKAGEQTKDSRGEWPWWAQFILAMFAMLLVALFLIGLPYAMTVAIDSQKDLDASKVWTAMIPTLLGLTTMTISGIFVFMTFRIDRGARAEARKTADKIVTDTVERKIQSEVVKEMDEQLANKLKEVDRHLDSSKRETDSRKEEAKQQLANRMKEAKQQLDSQVEEAKQQLANRMKEADRQLDNRMKEADQRMEARSEAADKLMEMKIKAVDERLTERFADADARISRRVADADDRVDETIHLGRSAR